MHDASGLKIAWTRTSLTGKLARNPAGTDDSESPSGSGSVAGRSSVGRTWWLLLDYGIWSAFRRVEFKLLTEKLCTKPSSEADSEPEVTFLLVVLSSSG
jgi:hypothetical protein